MILTLRYQVIGFALIMALGLATSPHAQTGQRIALLIGNQAYADAVGSLKNPYNDVKLVAAALRSTGFSVIVVKDASRLKILSALRVYSRRLKAAGPDAVGFFYYSGHGASETTIGPNYLIPVNVTSTDDSSLWDASIRLDEVIKRLKRGAPAAAHFVVFDACRNELRTQDKAISKGFVPEQSESGVYIAFATAQNRKASDQGKGSGPYARALAQQIIQPGQHHMDMFFNVKTAVRKQSNQTPWDRNGLLRRIYFGGKPQAPTSAAVIPGGGGQALELAYWATIKTSTDPADFKDYIAQFPKGIYVRLARRRIKKLARQSPKLVMSATPAPTPQYDPDYPFDGIWVGELCSHRFKRMTRVCKTRIAKITAGKLFTEWGRSGKPASGTIKGQVMHDGRIRLTISGRAGQAKIRGRSYIGHLSGRASRLKITTSGTYTRGRGVNYNLTRQSAPPPLPIAAKFDGKWRIYKQYSVCSASRKGQLELSIANSGIIAKGVAGTISSNGTLLFNRTKSGGRIATYKGRITGDFGSGSFEHENGKENKTCRGTFSIMRQTDRPSLARPGTTGNKDIAKTVQRELKRLGCYSGTIDGIWGNGSRRAVRRFNDNANTSLTGDNPQSISLTTLETQKGRVCPQIERKPAKRSRGTGAGTNQATARRSSSSGASCRLETKTECKRRVCSGGGCGLKGTGICKASRRRRIC